MIFPLKGAALGLCPGWAFLTERHLLPPAHPEADVACGLHARRLPLHAQKLSSGVRLILSSVRDPPSDSSESS